MNEKPELDDGISRPAAGFINTPFKDPLFKRLALAVDLTDDGRSWAADGVIRSRRLAGKNGMPQFSFDAGSVAYDGILTIAFDDSEGKRQASYIHSALARPHITVNTPNLPETVLISLAGESMALLSSAPALASAMITCLRRRQSVVIGLYDFLDVGLKFLD